jgi:hypothetical protein
MNTPKIDNPFTSGGKQESAWAQYVKAKAAAGNAIAHLQCTAEGRVYRKRGWLKPLLDAIRRDVQLWPGWRRR